MTQQATDFIIKLYSDYHQYHFNAYSHFNQKKRTELGPHKQEKTCPLPPFPLIFPLLCFDCYKILSFFIVYQMPVTCYKGLKAYLNMVSIPCNS